MKKKILIAILIVIAIVSVCFAFVGCNEETVIVELNYQITTQYTTLAIVEVDTLLKKPSDPTFTNQTFCAGVGKVIGPIDKNPLPIKNPRMGEGFDVNKDYLFIGWFKEPECIRPWVFSEDRVCTEITLYAKWIEI